MIGTTLTVCGIRKAYGGVHAVNDVSFEVGAQQMVAIIGPNGAGKSTCFNMVGGQIKPDSGTVHFEGKQITGLGAAQIWRIGIARTFQITATFASMTVRENVQMVLLSHQRQLAHWWRSANSHHREKADSLLALVGLHSQGDTPCGVLSYGDLKRLELSMALASQPKLLLMDEPTAGMAPPERIAMMNLAKAITMSQGIAILFTEHDMDVVFGHADHIIVLNRGRVIARGNPAAIRSDEQVQEVYLGGGTMFGTH